MPTMPESANQMPFVCKWLYSHPEPQQFKTQEELKNHIDKHDINSCNGSSLEDPIYICPWEGCNKRQSSIIKLEGIKNVNIFFAFASSTDTVEIIIIYCCIL
jgi:hypothetical protein